VLPWASWQHTCASVTKQYNLIPANGRWCLAGWEGNRRSITSHWPCVTDNSGITTYGLTALGREMSTPPKLQEEYGTLYLFLLAECTYCLLTRCLFKFDYYYCCCLLLLLLLLLAHYLYRTTSINLILAKTIKSGDDTGLRKNKRLTFLGDIVHFLQEKRLIVFPDGLK